MSKYMCNEIKYIKNKYNYNFEQLLINDANSLKKAKEIEEIAAYLSEKILEKYYIEDIKNHLYSIPIIGILKIVGFDIYRIKEKDDNDYYGIMGISHELTCKFNNDKIIILDSQLNAHYLCYIMACELAHFLFDFNEDKDIEFSHCFYGDMKSPEDKRAHLFAKFFLLPKDTFLIRYHYHKNMNLSNYKIIDNLSEDFLVPKSLIKERILDFTEDI